MENQQTLLYIRNDITVGELKKFLSNIPDESKIYVDFKLGECIRLDNYKVDDKTRERIEKIMTTPLICTTQDSPLRRSRTITA